MTEPTDREVLLARLTMLAVRAGIPHDVPVSGERWRVGRHARYVSPQVALTQLAALTKPHISYVEVEDGVIAVVANPTSGRRQSAFKDSFERRFGPGYHDLAILCIGRDESLVVTFGDFMEWQETHAVRPAAGHGGDPDGVPANAREEVARRGVVYSWTFTPFRGAETDHDRIRITKFSAGPVCSECQKRPAMYTVSGDDSGRPGRDLCQRCIDDLMTVEQFDRGRYLTRLQVELAELQRTAPPETLTNRAENEAMQWALRWQPSFLRAFIQAYRR